MKSKLYQLLGLPLPGYHGLGFVDRNHRSILIGLILLGNAIIAADVIYLHVIDVIKCEF